MSDPLIALPRAPVKSPSILDLLVAFATISVCGFGGVLAWSRRVIVESRQWMTAEEFTDAYALCQMLPGPNIVNLSVVFGSRIRGAIGAAVALVGLLGPPFVMIAVLGALYAHYGDLPHVQRALLALAAAAAGLVIATVAKMAEPLMREPLFPGPVVAAFVFAAVGVMRWPLHWVLLVLLPSSIALAWWRRR